MSTYRLERVVNRATELSDVELMNIVHSLKKLEEEELPQRQRDQITLLIGRVAFEVGERVKETTPEEA